MIEIGYPREIPKPSLLQASIEMRKAINIMQDVENWRGGTWAGDCGPGPGPEASSIFGKARGGNRPSSAVLWAGWLSLIEGIHSDENASLNPILDELTREGRIKMTAGKQGEIYP